MGLLVNTAVFTTLGIFGLLTVPLVPAYPVALSWDVDQKQDSSDYTQDTRTFSDPYPTHTSDDSSSRSSHFDVRVHSSNNDVSSKGSRDLFSLPPNWGENDGNLHRKRPLVKTMNNQVLRSSNGHRILHQRKHSRRLNDAMDYLIQYGYLKETKVTSDLVEKALREFQELAGLKVTGSLDRQTLRKMHKPRCGNADVSIGDFGLQKHRKRSRLKRFAQVSKWSQKLDSDDTLHLKWFIEHYTKDISKDQIRDIVSRAFKLWSDQVSIPSMRTIKLDFHEAESSQSADINIVWAERQHGDDYPFDGAGTTTNILAHTFYPNYQETGSLNGDIHFDDYEHWVLDNTTDPKGVHFPYVLVHEIGHALGLGHSKRQEAVMNPIYKQQALDTVVLDLDDKCAVNWNYIGPSNTCLFVWLMVELLPRAKESNSTAHGIGSSVHTAEGELVQRNQAVPEPRPQTAEQREQQLMQTLMRLKDKIPTCGDGNSVRDSYEYVLETKWELSSTSAHAYGPVVCNFFVGLNSYVDRLQQQGVPGEFGETEEETQGETSPREKRFSLETMEPDPEPVFESSGSGPRTIFDCDYFDALFFRNLVKLMVQN